MNNFFNLILFTLRSDECRLDYVNTELFKMLKQWNHDSDGKDLMKHVAFIYTFHEQSDRAKI